MNADQTPRLQRTAPERAGALAVEQSASLGASYSTTIMQHAQTRPATREHRLMGKYSLVAAVGFTTDASVLHLGLALHIEPAFARAISLITAMHVTFLINGLLVFKCLNRRSWPIQWGAYMLTNGFGNLCNYFVFVTLASLHDRVWSNHWLGLVAGGLTAWAINYTSARLLVFYEGRPLHHRLATFCEGIKAAPFQRLARLLHALTTDDAQTPTSSPSSALSTPRR